MMEETPENIRQIYPLNKTRIFTHAEALELVPLLMHISANTKRELNQLTSQQSFFKNNSEKSQELQNKINMVLQTWSDKVRRLGAIPVSLCKVRIPGEDNHFIWEYPENRLYLQ